MKTYSVAVKANLKADLKVDYVAAKADLKVDSVDAKADLKADSD
jgi:hypothetical protein